MRRRVCACGKKLHTLLTRTLSVAAAAALTAALIPAVAADPVGDGVTSTCDEAYYATLDYYGNLTNGSVVKSYALNGLSKITDYGTYDEVNNLTDGTVPTDENGATVFDFGSDAPDHFYFEGKTAAPYAALPWTISLSYALNGVPTRAEDLAGKTGVVQIKLDLVPNPAASDYAKNNYTLEAMTLFNQDDILSLKAEGAQVQLVGNLRAVLFVALPGEEEHFTIEVGAQDFSFGGMTFLMVPATLAQLQDIADLADRKDDIEDDYDKLDGSLDTFLNSLDAMTGSLRDTAKGLDELNAARDTISKGKGDVYGKADAALSDLDKLSESLSTLPGHLDSASQAVTDVTDDLTALTKTSTEIKEDLADVRKALTELQDDLQDVRGCLNGDAKKGDLELHLTSLGKDADSLNTSVSALKNSLGNLDVQISGNLGNDISLNGNSINEINQTLLPKAKNLDQVYRAAGGGKALSRTQFISAAMDASGATAQGEQLQEAIEAAIAAAMESNPDLTPAQAQEQVLAPNTALGQQYAQAQEKSEAAKALMGSIYDATASGGSMDEAAFFTAMIKLQAASSETEPAKISAIVADRDGTYAKQGQSLLGLYQMQGSSAVPGLLSDLSSLCGDLGSDGVTGDLTELVKLSDTVLADLDTLGDHTDAVLKDADTLLGQVKDLDDTVNQYVPDLKSTLEDLKTITSATTGTLTDTHSFLSAFESLMKKSGTQLDSGTKKTLEGLADTLRKTAGSIDTTDSIRSAKDNISGIIRDTWNEHTGDKDNLLNMDATAEAVSLTSAKNAAPESVQVLIRSQEIKVPDTAKSERAAAAAQKTTFWGRVAQMFKDFWHAITGIFHH